MRDKIGGGHIAWYGMLTTGLPQFCFPSAAPLDALKSWDCLGPLQPQLSPVLCLLPWAGDAAVAAARLPFWASWASSLDQMLPARRGLHQLKELRQLGIICGAWRTLERFLALHLLASRICGTC